MQAEEVELSRKQRRGNFYLRRRDFSVMLSVERFITGLDIDTSDFVVLLQPAKQLLKFGLKVGG